MTPEQIEKTSLPIIKRGKSKPNVKIYIQVNTDSLKSLDGAINLINLLKSQQA